MRFVHTQLSRVDSQHSGAIVAGLPGMCLDLAGCFFGCQEKVVPIYAACNVNVRLSIY